MPDHIASPMPKFTAASIPRHIEMSTELGYITSESSLSPSRAVSETTVPFCPKPSVLMKNTSTIYAAISRI